MPPPEETLADEFEKDLRLKKIDHEHEEYIKRLDNEWALRRDTLQFTKDYGLFTLRSCLALNGGAIIAMLAFVGNLYGPNVGNHIKLHDFSYAIGLFAFGLVAAAAASICGYFNFIASQKRYIESFALLRAKSLIGAATPDYGATRSRILATVFVMTSLMSFVFGIAAVIYVLWLY